MEVAQVTAAFSHLPSVSTGELSSHNIIANNNDTINMNECEKRDEVLSSPEIKTNEENPSPAPDKDATSEERVEAQQAPPSPGGQQRGRRSGGSRGGRGRRQAGRKGSWKKLDTEVGFPGKNRNSSGPRTEKRNDKQDAATVDAQDGTASSSSSKSNTHTKTYQSRRSRGGVGRRKNSVGNGDTAETNPNWREHKTTSSKRPHRGRKKSSRNHHPNGTTMFAPQAGEGLEIVKKKAIGQIEYFFTADELCKNTYLRNHMDTEGYLPAAIVFNFPSVVRFSVPYDVLLSAVASSETLEVDTVNETMRINGDFKKWLYPNGEGGFGCPRWIKQPLEEEEATEDVQQDSDKPEVVICTSEVETSTTTTGKGDIDCNESNTAPDLVRCTDSETDSDCKSG